MTEFYKALLQYEERFKDMQKKEQALQLEAHTLQSAFQGWLKESGLPEQFTMAEVMTLAVRKSRE